MAVAQHPLPGRPLPELLELLSNETRLRICALLDQEELSVGELARALGLAQSRVSNHLRLLREAALLAERHAGASTHLRLAGGGGAAARLWELVRGELEHLPERAADLARLDQVLAARRGRDSEFFERVAGEWDKLAGDFAHGAARERAAALLLPRTLAVADLGCGTGYMGRALLGVVGRLVCVDRSAAMLEQARARLAPRAAGTELEFRQGEFDRLPLADGEVDGALAGMVLHHLPELGPALAEMRRVVRPGGQVVVLELLPHREEWMQGALGDRYLGLAPADVLAALARAGFVDVALDSVDDAYRPRREDGADVELPLYLARGTVPSGPRPAANGHSGGASAPSA